jgi:hypothetical protein
MVGPLAAALLHPPAEFREGHEQDAARLCGGAVSDECGCWRIVRSEASA